MYRFLLPLALLPTAAAAQSQGDVPEAQSKKGGILPVSGDVLLLSDYRFRGVSRSDAKPALQGQLTLSLPGGLYVGTRATTLRRQNLYGDAEFDVYAGLTREIGSGTTLDAGLQYYAFAGGRGGAGYAEPYASVSHTLGPVQATAGAKYAWGQGGTGGRQQLYLFGQAEAGIPLTPVTLTAELGRQAGGLLPRYWNWSLGGRYRLFGPVEAGLRYVDTDLASGRGRKAGLVGSLGFRF